MITMYLTPILWFEIAIATLMGVGLLCLKVEYALFLYGLALGFPDFALPLGTTINVRADDVLILLFLIRTILWSPAPPTPRQKNIFKWQGLFLLACVLSIVVETVRGNPPAGYEATKMAGCAVIFLVLPRIVQSERRLQFFVAGLMSGGVALAIQIHQHLGESSSNDFANFQEFKSAATFTTWNPNTIGQAAILLVFAAGLGGSLFISKTLTHRILWPCFAMGFALVPASMFVRGACLSIAAGFILFLCMARRWKWVLAFAVVSLCAVLYLHSVDRRLLEAATTVNVKTGEGFSSRFERWDMAFQAIQTRLFVGQGFGQEWTYLSLIGSEGRAHNDYLTVWLELGLGGLLLFVGATFQFVRAGFLLYKNPRFQLQGALILALLVALGLDSFGLPTLYWEKLPTIALSLAMAVAGMCERNDSEIPVEAAQTFAYEPFAQNL
jgi:O-antigen ligase